MFSKTSIVLTLFLECYVMNHVVHASGTIDDLIRLTDTLFSNYSKAMRPVYNVSDTLTVDTSFFLLSILDVDEVSGTIVLSGGIGLSWKDFRLTWSPCDNGGIDNTIVNASWVWKPKAFLISSAADLERFGSDEFDVRIGRNGSIYESPGKLIKSSCTVDMTNFPIDSQKCSLLLLPWGYYKREITLSYTHREFFMDLFSPNGEWNVDKTLVENSSLDRGRYSVIVISMIIPTYILCFLNPFVFLLPASSGERVSYIITMFLSLAVYMTMIVDNMPKVSEPMAGISYFLLISMIYSCLLIILTIFTLRCDAASDVRTFPTWLIRLVHGFTNRGQNKNDKETEDKLCKAVETSGLKNIDSTSEEKLNDNELLTTIHLDKSDVIDFIDKSPFLFTLTITVPLMIGFTLRYYTSS